MPAKSLLSIATSIRHRPLSAKGLMDPTCEDVWLWIHAMPGSNDVMNHRSSEEKTMATQLHARVHELTRREAVELLQFHGYVGRIGFVVDGRPLILPVNYLADDDSIVFCTGPGTKLSAIGRGASVVFEVDDSRALEHSGWSVVVKGTAHEIIDEGELDELRRGPLHSWATRSSEHWVRLSIEEVTGRRLHGS
jgi:nitroimidazol reductase NimA-like FMN-containing flavoprotein (pyridoxamine 5'-phosphate oxidase superfamily)